MFLFIKRYLASNKFFWKYRHYFQINFFSSNYGEISEKFYNKILSDLKPSSILDFGCATGDKLIYLSKVKKKVKIIYGIDINQKAIQVAKIKASKEKVEFFFSNNLDQNEMREFLKKAKIKKFDLVIFDRVLYILNTTELNKILLVLSNYTKYFLINDFFLENKKNNSSKHRINIKGYFHTNFDNLMKEKSFDLVTKFESPNKKVNFANSKVAIYKKTII
tara:strand:+ start:672 stop:1331 length:660 start_codon:yes stop_codon:yes gene_type:complete